MNRERFFSTLPSLVINLTDRCNFCCGYCPPYGENMCKGTGEYDESAILEVIRLAKSYNLPMLRLTGGEPFLEPERVRLILDVCGNSFSRLVVNTNGSLIGEHLDWLESYKSNFVLKVSLDSMSSKGFQKMTGVNLFSVVHENLLEVVNRDFNLEINCVIYDQPFDDLCAIVNFAIANGIDCKLLTISTFHGTVSSRSDHNNLGELIEYLKKLASDVMEEQLVGGVRGGAMIVYQIGRSKVILFDHSIVSSLTPKKTFMSLCENECSFYPCDCGAISIYVSTDGILSACRGRKDLGANIFSRNKTEIESTFVQQLNYYKSCFAIDINTRQQI